MSGLVLPSAGPATFARYSQTVVTDANLHLRWASAQVSDHRKASQRSAGLQAAAQQRATEQGRASSTERENPSNGSSGSSSRSGGKYSEDEYPSKDSTSGGWAGGEVGLRNFLEAAPNSVLDRQKKEAQGKAAQKGAPKKSPAKPSSTAQPVDPAMYPSKSAVGPFEGITGGFAGGERGVRQFVEEGKIRFADPGASQYSPLIVALVVSVGVTAAAILLNAEVEQGEQALGPVTLPRIKSLNIDAATVPLVQSAAIGLAVLGLLTGSGFLARKLSEGTNRAASTVLNGARSVVFWFGLFLAVKVVLDSS